MILKSLLVIACIAVYVRAQQPCLHAPQNPHSFAASSLSCAHYTICMGGNTIVGPDQQCQAGLNFDPPSQTCGETSCLECSPFGIQNLAHPDDCYQYIECILGNRRILTCPSGLMFDRSIGQCNEAHAVVCPGYPGYPTDDPFPTEPWPADPWPTDPWPTDPWPEDPWPTCPTPTPQPPGPVCRGQVFHAHPTDCNRFFMCLDEILWEHSCPSDLHWNQLINACDFPEYARCLAGSGTTTSDPPIWPPPEDTTTGKIYRKTNKSNENFIQRIQPQYGRHQKIRLQLFHGQHQIFYHPDPNKKQETTNFTLDSSIKRVHNVTLYLKKTLMQAMQ